MKSSIRAVLIIILSIFLAGAASAQVDDICAEFGATPSFDNPSAGIPYVYGRITLKGYDPAAKFPRITVVLVDPQQTQKRLTVEKSGNYCFKRTAGSSGTIVVDVDGVEVARRSFSSFGGAQIREDFEIHRDQRAPAPATVSAKFFHPPNDKTVDIYRKAAEAERNKDLDRTIKYLKEVVEVDPSDFIAWAKLGSIYLQQKSLPDAEAALRKSIALKEEYTPAWINVGQIRLAQKQYEAAIEVFKHAAMLDRESARAFQLLGESYLLAKQGTLGAQALNEAIRLDPVGMAECHLQLAHLYQLAGAKQLATREYKIFLTKIPDHPEKKKFEKFIKDNPE